MLCCLSTWLTCSTLVLLHSNTKVSAHKPCTAHKSALFSVHSQSKICLFFVLLCNLRLDLFSCFHFLHQLQQACRFVCMLQHTMQLQRNWSQRDSILCKIWLFLVAPRQKVHLRLQTVKLIRRDTVRSSQTIDLTPWLFVSVTPSLSSSSTTKNMVPPCIGRLYVHSRAHNSFYQFKLSNCRISVVDGWVGEGNSWLCTNFPPWATSQAASVPPSPKTALPNTQNVVVQDYKGVFQSASWNISTRDIKNFRKVC